MLQVVPPPALPINLEDTARWADIERVLDTRLPTDLYEFATRYGSGYFDDPRRLVIYVWNPFSSDYLGELDRSCQELREDRGDLPKEPNIPYGVYPHRPGWLPWGSDIDGSLMCWLTEGEPDDWPIILLSPERTSFQQLHMPMTTFLAGVFTRQIQTILWEDSAFFSGPEPVRFVPLPS